MELQTQQHMSKSMTKNHESRRVPLWALAFSVLVAPAFASDSGLVTFADERQTYIGQYSISDLTLSVEIEGMKYRGNFSETISLQDRGRSGATSTEPWGKAFLFGSSAKVLQCQLDSGFPRLKGNCQGSDGRKFRLDAERDS